MYIVYMTIVPIIIYITDTLIFVTCKITQKTDKVSSAYAFFLLKNKYSDPVSAFISK